MNAKLTTLTALVAVAAAFASPAFAKEATPDGFAAVTSTISRDAVRADAIAALKAGTIERGEASVDRSVFVSTKSRLQVAAEAREALDSLSRSIDHQFDRWELSPAEREVALLLLKGFSLKEIAALRATAERTARQQSLAVYRKADLAGRAELSAFFLEDLLAPHPDAGRD